MPRTIAALMYLLLMSQLSPSAWGQPASRMAVIGWLALSAGPNDPAVQALRNGLRDLSYIEGRDFRIEHRSAGGRVEQLPGLADELIRSKVDLILTATNEATRAAMRATSTIPIVAVVSTDDPISLGFVQSLNRPGGNVTGITTRNTILAGKRLQLLKEILPGVTHVAVFLDSFGQAELEELKPASATLGIRLHLIDLAPNYDLSRAFREARAQKAGAVMVLGSAVLYVRSGQLGAMALENKLPLIGQWRALVDSGALMSYSTDVTDGFYRSAYWSTGFSREHELRTYRSSRRQTSSWLST